MKLVRWSFHNIHIPMMEDDDRNLFCTSHSLTRALGIDEEALKKVYERHKEEFETVRVTDSHAKEFLKENKVEFGIRRVRNDMILWTEGDMLLVAILSRSSISRDFRSNLIEFIKKNASRGMVSREEWNRLEQEVEQLRSIILYAQPAIEATASAAGTALNAQKETKSLRLVK